MDVYKVCCKCNRVTSTPVMKLGVWASTCTKFICMECYRKEQLPKAQPRLETNAGHGYYEGDR